jgi:hypothetical protein
MKAFATAAAAAVLVAGCAGIDRVTEDPPSLIYSLQDFAAAGDGRDFRVDIQGNPFAVDQQSFDRAVTDAMQGHHFGPRTHFTTTPNDTSKPGYRVVMVFNPATPFPNSVLCLGQRFPTLPPNGGTPVHAQAAFCSGGVATSLSAYLGQAQGPDDPAFRRLVGDMTLSLFPPTNPERNNSCSGRPFC